LKDRSGPVRFFDLLPSTENEGLVGTTENSTAYISDGNSLSILRNPVNGRERGERTGGRERKRWEERERRRGGRRRSKKDTHIERDRDRVNKI